MSKIPAVQIRTSWTSEILKYLLVRVLEIVVSSLSLILTLPLMIVIGVFIRLDSPGPALFWQTRIGLNGREFKFVKFRTLYSDARERFPDLYAYQYTDAEIQKLMFKLRDDPRVTRVGRWLRSTTLDELPNFWNVLMGDMTLVGPRPEIPEMLRYYNTPEMLAKFSVRPGVTGLSQVLGRGDLSFLETVNYDLKYVRERNFAMDVAIIIKTIRAIIGRNGAF